ncbi:MAG: ComF family protein [Ignavibacteriales bacterium]|nr:ComF family protein [Ignavibacteriales bacterium]
MGAILRVFQPFVDFVYPPTCVSCDQLLEEGARHVCPACWKSIPRISRDHRLYVDTRGKILAQGIVDDLVSVFVFEKTGAFQELAHALKYEGFESIGLKLGRELGEVMKQWGVQAEVLIPVPLHKVKHRERGFNQSALIARGAAGVMKLPVKTDWLARTRNTRTQTQLSLEERERNVEGAFVVSEKGLDETEGKTVIIIDDVITTGSTIVSCAERLLEAGAAKIIAASAALAE